MTQVSSICLASRLDTDLHCSFGVRRVHCPLHTQRNPSWKVLKVSLQLSLNSLFSVSLLPLSLALALALLLHKSMMSTCIHRMSHISCNPRMCLSVDMCRSVLLFLQLVEEEEEEEGKRERERKKGKMQLLSYFGSLFGPVLSCRVLSCPVLAVCSFYFLTAD